eukprot:7550778-Alexandrium_andersonii.AAC.1
MGIPWGSESCFEGVPEEFRGAPRGFRGVGATGRPALGRPNQEGGGGGGEPLKPRSRDAQHPQCR